MLTDLISIHNEVLAVTPVHVKRYLYNEVNWDSQAICLLGHRGVGKTTMMCQFMLEHYPSVNKALYLSADNIHVLSNGLFAIATEFFRYGGEALFIDEVHKYPNWSGEIKNILDTYRTKKVVFSASSLLDLKRSKYDLSRRVLYYELNNLSFREYLSLATGVDYGTHTLSDILDHHTKLAKQYQGISVLKHFRDYLEFGVFPFFLEGKNDYLSRLSNIVEKVLYEDITSTFDIKTSTITILKKLLWLIATGKSLTPNMDRISSALSVSRPVVYNSFEHLHAAGLICNIYPNVTGMRLIRKPGKVFLDNTNLLYTISGELKHDEDTGNVRETFFVNQVGHHHKVNLHNPADFIIDESIVVEVGGKSKDTHQLTSEDKGYLAIDDIEVGFGNRIPLYLFGFLY